MLFTFRKARQKIVAGACCSVTRTVLDEEMYEREVMFGGTENVSKEVGENEGNSVGVPVLEVTLTEGDAEGEREEDDDEVGEEVGDSRISKVGAAVPSSEGNALIIAMRDGKRVGTTSVG